MIDIKRKIYTKLVNWKSQNGKTVLLLQGARRVGKSYIVEKFAKNEYKSYILIDFSTMLNNVSELFEYNISDLDSFFFKLSRLFNVDLYERNSLIIFDEIQLFPLARQALKTLVKDGRYDYIETGSLISIKKNVSNILIPSEEEILNMYPLDFEEYLTATNNNGLIDIIREAFNNKHEIGQATNRKVLDLFYQYMVVGGMPQSVAAFIETKSFKEVEIIKRAILNLYKNDCRKYGSTKVLKMFNEIPSQLKKTNRHFKLSSIQKGERFENLSNVMFFLEDAMIVNNCFDLDDPNIGFNQNKNTNLFKSYYSDTGLLLQESFDVDDESLSDLYKKIIFGNIDTNLGMICENIVGQLLVSSGHRLYFYTNNDRNDCSNTMEIDFIIRKKSITSKNNISAIEVKSGNNYTLSSLRKFKAKYSEYLNNSYVLHFKDYKYEDGIYYLPIYMAMYL